ncbi:Hypothetical predicted protein [Drosophila guanche]|uniref:Secreted protein n=1 Tax=Drosophila guanche TaxID=7266 RepID=A0A3B0KUX0_DROGU|nr:Hypothetical predicted protein [Drosophila guanche]
MFFTGTLTIICCLACFSLVQMQATVDLAEVYNVTDWKAREVKDVSVDAADVIDHYYAMPLAADAQDLAKMIVSNAKDLIANCIIQFFKDGCTENFHLCVDQVVTNSVRRLSSLHNEGETLTSGASSRRPGLLWF